MGSALGVASGIISGCVASGAVVGSLTRAELGKAEIGYFQASIFGIAAGSVVGFGVNGVVTAIQQESKSEKL